MNQESIELIYETVLADYFYYSLVKRYPKLNLEYLKKEIKSEFEILLTDYYKIDVDHASEFMDSFIESIIYLSAYKVLSQFLDLNEIVNLIHENYIYRIESSDTNRFLENGEHMFSKENISEIREAAKKSQMKKYSDDYLVFFLEGKGEEFDFGNNTYQCPIHTFFKQHDAIEFLGCVCDIDFIRSNYLQSGLKREKCLSTGDDHCSFRWKKGHFSEKSFPLGGI